MPAFRAGWLTALLLFLCMSIAQAQQLVPVPPLTGRVVDQANMLDPAQRQQLEAVLADYETTSGSQIAVLLVSKTEPEAIEQYGIRVAEAWKLGRKGIDDGVLLLVAKDNPPALRRLRIEAGRGVQGSLTDAQSKRILQDVIAPHFKQNQYYDGLVAGVSAIAALVSKEGLAAPEQRATPRQQEEDGWGSYLIPLVIFFVLASILRPRRRSALARNSWGRSGMDVATGMVIGNILGGISRGGGGFGGGGFGGGGFSGGGGTFDGGGASGDW
jgi:uncharacterized protein